MQPEPHWRSARGTFEVSLVPAGTEIGGAVQRTDLAKTFSGQLTGSARGVMLSAGNPATGHAGYVAVEAFAGTVDGRPGSFVLQQLGTMCGESRSLHYVVVDGSGTEELAGITGTVSLVVDDEGTHHVELRYALPDD